MKDGDRSRSGLSFDSVAEAYASVRPHYPDALFADLASLGGLHSGTEVLEIGCGPGIATRALLDRGWHVHAVEPGPRMAAIARRQGSIDQLEVDVSTFEEWEPAGRRFGLVFSATAFHWVDPRVR